MFRAPVVALKAAAMNLLSVAAAYGVMTAVFQWGWGAELLGLPGAVPVSSWVPILMFTILFGLSMDYEVFLLSRVREDWLATGDPHAQRGPRPGVDRSGDHQRGGDHDRGVRRVRARPGRDREDDRRRHGRRRC